MYLFSTANKYVFVWWYLQTSWTQIQLKIKIHRLCSEMFGAHGDLFSLQQISTILYSHVGIFVLRDCFYCAWYVSKVIYMTWGIWILKNYLCTGIQTSSLVVINWSVILPFIWLGFLSRIYLSSLNHGLMAGNLNSGHN